MFHSHPLWRQCIPQAESSQNIITSQHQAAIALNCVQSHLCFISVYFLPVSKMCPGDANCILFTQLWLWKGSRNTLLLGSGGTVIFSQNSARRNTLFLKFHRSLTHHRCVVCLSLLCKEVMYVWDFIDWHLCIFSLL